MTREDETMQHGTLPASFQSAGWGLLHTVATQRNMKIHLTAAVMVMIVGMALPLDLASRTALLFCVALVFFAEILNSALEHFVDLHIREFARGAMLAKDAAAAGVLVLASATVAILVDILYVEWEVVKANLEAVQRSVVFGLPLTGITVLLLWGPQQPWVKAAMALAAFGFALPLWYFSVDPLFSALLGAFVGLAVASRPRLAEQVPPGLREALEARQSAALEPPAR